MYVNPLRRAVEENRIQIGTWITLARNPAILALLKSAGLDFVRIDMEHATPSIETVADMAAFARALDFPVVVRPPVASRDWIARLLAAGVLNFHCPQVETAQQAAEIVAAARYAPVGQRGNAELGPANDFDPAWLGPAGRAHANRQVFITAMIETGGAFEHLDAIAAMDGIDALTLGPADLAQDLGIVGKPEQARIIDEKRELVLQAARRHGKTCAMLVNSAQQARQWQEAGALLLAYSSDVDMLHSGFRRAMAEIKGPRAPAAA